MYYARHRVLSENFVLRNEDIFAFQLTTNIEFLKEDYYV